MADWKDENYIPSAYKYARGIISRDMQNYKQRLRGVWLKYQNKPIRRKLMLCRTFIMTGKNLYKKFIQKRIFHLYLITGFDYFRQECIITSFIMSVAFLADTPCIKDTPRIKLPIFNKYLYNTIMYHNVPKFSDRQVWANSADPDQTAPRGAVCADPDQNAPRGAVWSGSTLFTIPSASFGRITLRKSHLVQLLGWLQQIFGCPEF